MKNPLYYPLIVISFLLSVPAIAQHTNNYSQTIVIKNNNPKKNVTVSVNEGVVTINGKPATEFKDGDVQIIVRNSLNKRDGLSTGTDSIFIHGNQLFAYQNDSFGLGLPILTDVKLKRLNGLPGAGSKKLMLMGSKRPILGVIFDKTDTSKAVIASVLPNFPAHKAGLQKGDIITAINGKSISSPNTVVQTMSTTSLLKDSATSLKITYNRLGTNKEATVILPAISPNDISEISIIKSGDLPFDVFSSKPFNDSSFIFNFDSPTFQKRMDNLNGFKGDFDIEGNITNADGSTVIINGFGNKSRMGLAIKETKNPTEIMVERALPQSAAEAAGFMVGDIITAINEKAFSGFDDAVEKLRNSYNANDDTKVAIKRNGKTQTLTIKKEKNLKKRML